MITNAVQFYDNSPVIFIHRIRSKNHLFSINPITYRHIDCLSDKVTTFAKKEVKMIQLKAGSPLRLFSPFLVVAHNFFV